MEVLLNKLFDKHSEGYGVYNRENLIKDICKELQNLQLQQTSVNKRFYCQDEFYDKKEKCDKQCITCFRKE